MSFPHKWPACDDRWRGAQASRFRVCGRKNVHRLLQLVHPLIGLVALVGCGLAPNLAGHPEIVDNDRRAAAHGSPENQYHLGLRYFGGRGVTKDEAEAVKWFRKAADQGHLGAQYMLGVAYSAGQGVAQDGSESVKWLAKAAEEGHPRAQYLLGDAYLNGRAVARDPAWAGRWFGKAAYQGVAEAQYSLGVVFAAGLGVPRNRRVAWQWLTLAQRAGHPDAGRLRNAVEPGLSEKQMRIAGQWVARYSPARGAAYADDPTVRYVQFSLDVLGYSVGSIDGVIGERTRAAIQRYQADVGLSDRARIGPALLARLRMDARQAA